jgi:DDE superfamily endonuclease
MITNSLHRGMRYIFLPPYSPDLNPIELAFSSLKACFKRNRDMVEECWGDEQRAQELLIRLAFRVTPEMAAGWYAKCGY